MSNINLNKYADRAAYNADTRPAGENCVSLVGQEVIYDGVNVILKKEQLRRDDVCLVFWDNTDNCYVFIPIETYKASKLDTTRYSVQNYVRFTRSLGRDVVMHKDEIAANLWAERNRYKLECITSSPGSFSWSVTINGTLKSGTVSWTAGATLDNIVTQMNAGAVTNYLTFSHEQGEDFIRITKGGYSNSIFAITDIIGYVTLTDLSERTKIAGIVQDRKHRDWLSQSVNVIFPESGFLPPIGKIYARNGFSYTTQTGTNYSLYKTRCGDNGSSTYVAEDSASPRMKQAAFEALNGSGVAEKQALYDKYNGSWDAYIFASMVKIDDSHIDGIEYQSYKSGDFTQFMASVTTEDFDGKYIPAYPLSHFSKQKTDSRGVLSFNMPTVHDIAAFMEDSNCIKINESLSAINGDLLSVLSDYTSINQYNQYSQWIYLSYYGGFSYQYSKSFKTRAIAYLD